MQYSSLNKLIEGLEYGTKLHIGVMFFGFRRNEKLILPKSATIRTADYCWKIKENREDAQKCLICRDRAIRKAVLDGKPFGGVCIHGVWEYNHPVFVDGNLIGIIFS